MLQGPFRGAWFTLTCVSLWFAGCAARSGADAELTGAADDINALDASSDADPGSPTDRPDPLPVFDAGNTPLPRDPNDRDGDGVRGGADCDDDDATRYPGAPERCDGKDNDCDEFVDTFAIDARTWYPDADGDGFGNGKAPVRSCEAPAGWVTNGSDCDDGDPQLGEGGEFCEVAERPVVYVARHGHDDNAGDAPMRAVRTVGRGIQRALACPEEACSVLIAEGTYEEPVTVADGVSLFGGYSADFTERDRSQHEVIITSQATHTLSAVGLRRETKLEGMTVEGATLTGESGRSSYAAWVSDSADALKLADLTIRAGAGEAGAKGAQGEPQSCDARGGQGGVAFDCGGSQGGMGDASGDPVLRGVGGQGGRSNCPSACPLTGSDGVSDGETGERGLNGQDARGGFSASGLVGSFSEQGWFAPQSEDGPRGYHGTGGGGGGSGGTKRIRACFGCGTILGGRGAEGAPGGCGGGGGKAGSGGGGAFALVIIDSQVSLRDVTLTGGQGGPGAGGGDGIAGQPGSQVTGLNREEASSKKCGLIRYHAGAGGVGGVGGAGGAGGGGAGGVGGAAITVALVGAASTVEAGAVTLEVGVGGPGGAGGSGPGAPGQAGAGGTALATQRF